ncbi:MAG: 30S ribosomal protein S20 [Alphaproteobacteria bacterium]
MAHSRSARKRVRTAARRTEINRARRSRVRTFIKKVEAMWHEVLMKANEELHEFNKHKRSQLEAAVAAGDQSAARAALTAAQPEIMRGVTKGTMHKNTASRKISRLSAAVKRMA